MKRQFGKIRISRGLVDSNDLRILDLFMSIGFIPIEADYYTSYDEVVYTGRSKRFQELNIGENIPYYQVVNHHATVTQEGRVGE